MRKPRKRTKVSHKIADKIYDSWMLPGGYYDNVRISKIIKKVLSKEIRGKYDETYLVNKYLIYFRKINYDLRNIGWYRRLLR